MFASKSPCFLHRSSSGIVKKLSVDGSVFSHQRNLRQFAIFAAPSKQQQQQEFSSSASTPPKYYFSTAPSSKRQYNKQPTPTFSSMFTTTEDITDIEEIHKQALQNGARSYEDPETGFTVFTEKFHLERGTCCGNQCRHCPYGWQNVAREEFRRPAKLQSGDKEAARKLLDEMGQANSSGSPTKGRFKKRVGGTSGGRLTDKNVPYTKKGDSGTSQLLTGERRKKDDPSFEAMGTVDELCTVVGVAHAMLLEASRQQEQLTGKPIDYGELPEWLLQVMSRLFDAGSHIAKPVKVKKATADGDDDDDDDSVEEDKQEARTKFKADGVGGGMDVQHVEALEDWIDTMTELLPECKSFLLPSGSVASAQLHVCRTVCRRAERTLIPLVDAEVCDPNVMSYVNRLSDFLFVASRWANFCQGAPEIEYRRPEKRDKQRVATAKEWNGASDSKRPY